MNANRPRIMIVEDEQILAYDLKLRLERMGYEVAVPVAAGDQVLAEIERSRPALILMDVLLRGPLDGIQVADKIRARFSLPVVYLTAYSNKQTLERAKRTAPFGFIRKPATDHELHTSLEMALYKHALDERLRRSEALLAVTLRNLGEAVITFDAEGRIEFMNRMAERLSGWPADEARGRAIGAVLSIIGESSPEPLDLQAAYAGGRLSLARAIRNCKLRARDNRLIPVEISLSALEDAPPQSRGMVVMLRDVSDRESARLEIEALQKQMEFVLMETGTHVDIIDAQFNLRYVDPGWQKFYGEISGHKCYEYFMGRASPCPGCGIIRALATKAKAVTEEIMVRENNRPVQVTTVPYQTPDGEWLVAELNVDLTERKRVENAMRVQRDLGLALAAADSPAAAMELFLNAALQINGVDCGGIYHRDGAGSGLSLIAARGLSAEFIRTMKWMDPSMEQWKIIEAGRPVYMQSGGLLQPYAAAASAEGLRAIAVLPIKHHARLVGCCNLASRNLDEIPEHARNTLDLMISQVGDFIGRLQAEQAVRESEARYRHLFDNAPVGYHEIDRRGLLTHVNATELKMLGYSEEEMVGRPIWDFVLQREEVRDALERQLASGAVPDASFEWTFVRRGGGRVPMLVKSYAMFGEPGRIRGIRSALQDITEQKKSDAERARFAARMSEIQKLESIGLLAGGIAHDFNNLLMGIQGNVELALMKMPTDAPPFSYLQDIRAACRRAAELTSQLLAYAGKGKYLVQSVNLAELIRGMLQLLKTLAGHHAEVQFNLEDGAPCVEADASQLRQVVMNLITNSVEAMQNKHGAIQVALRGMDIAPGYVPSKYCQNHTLPPGRYAELTVQDNGCGIDPEGMQRLFEPFYTTKFMGRGLGLAAVLGIVRNHGGDIKVASRSGQGAEFRIVLPAAAKVGQAPGAGGRQTPSPA